MLGLAPGDESEPSSHPGFNRIALLSSELDVGFMEDLI